VPPCRDALEDKAAIVGDDQGFFKVVYGQARVAGNEIEDFADLRETGPSRRLER
jgi:hypothetical protein